MSKSTELSLKAGAPHQLFLPYLYGVVTLGVAVLGLELFKIPRGYECLVLVAVTGLTSFYCVNIPTLNSKI